LSQDHRKKPIEAKNSSLYWEIPAPIREHLKIEPREKERANPGRLTMNKAFLLAGACFLLLTRLAAADNSYGVPTSPPLPEPNGNGYGSPTGGGTDSSGSAHETADVQSKMADLESKYKTETTEAIKLARDRYIDNLKQLLQAETDKGDQGAVAAVQKKLNTLENQALPVPTATAVSTPKPVPRAIVVTNSRDLNDLKRLRSNYDSDIKDVTEAEELSSIKERYRDDLNQLFRKEMVKGDESTALAVKLEMRRTLPGYPFIGQWAVRPSWFSVLHFAPNGQWTEVWGAGSDCHYWSGQWSAVDDKTVAVTRNDNYVWHYRLTEEGHLIRDDSVDYAPEVHVHAYAAPASDGSIRLEADDADLVGSHICLEGDSPDDIGFWTDSSDSATWQVRVDKPGDYQVVFDYALDPGATGSVVVLSGGGDQLTFTPPATGGWTDYQTQNAGKIHLTSARPIEIDLTALDKPGAGVMNLRSITLLPSDP
jgi:hypothetical protein